MIDELHILIDLYCYYTVLVLLYSGDRVNNLKQYFFGGMNIFTVCF